MTSALSTWLVPKRSPTATLFLLRRTDWVLQLHMVSHDVSINSTFIAYLYWARIYQFEINRMGLERIFTLAQLYWVLSHQVTKITDTTCPLKEQFIESKIHAHVRNNWKRPQETIIFESFLIRHWSCESGVTPTVNDTIPSVIVSCLNPIFHWSFGFVFSKIHIKRGFHFAIIWHEKKAVNSWGFPSGLPPQY